MLAQIVPTFRGQNYVRSEFAFKVRVPVGTVVFFVGFDGTRGKIIYQDLVMTLPRDNIRVIETEDEALTLTKLQVRLIKEQEALQNSIKTSIDNIYE